MDNNMGKSSLTSLTGFLLAMTKDGGGGGSCHQNDPCTLALNNPLIVRQIFSHLDIKNVKKVRRVCKSWEDEGSFILGKLCRLSLYRLCNNYKTTKEKIAVNPKLLQTIFIPASGRCVFKYQGGYPFLQNVATVCFNSFASDWKSFVQEIHVDLDIVNVDIAETLKVYGSRNLKKMTIIKKRGFDANFSLELGCINTLKGLKIVGHDFRKSCSYPLLQNMINSAPNLEGLDIEGNFYPDLASCRKLKVLKWMGCRSVELEEGFRMINEVGHQLEHLTVGVMCPYSFDEKLKNSFLRLPKLKSLTLKTADILEVVDQICPALLPNLEILSCQYANGLDFRRVDQGSFLTHEGVKSLELLGVEGADLIAVALKRFPNVKRLVIRIADGGLALEQVLCTNLQACCTWKLNYLEVQIHRRFKLSQLLDGLKSLSLLEGIKEVKIQSLRYFVDDDAEVDGTLTSFKEVLQLSEKLDRMVFKDLTLAPNTKKKVFEFLHQHKDDLPVFYLD